MTTMNNTINTAKMPTYISMRNTILNGESWDFLLDISPLAEEEVAPVIDCLVTGTLDEKFDTPKICEYIQSVMGGAAEALVHFCFEDGKYNHFYTIKLISDVMEVGLCCEECCVKEVTKLHQLYVDYMEGSETATDRIVQSLYTFFVNTMPFVFDVI